MTNFLKSLSERCPEQNTTDDQVPPGQTLQLWIKIEENNLDNFFEFHENDRHLTIKNSPLGVSINDGDTIVSFDNKDVRGMNPEEFSTNVFPNTETDKLVKVWILRKGFDPIQLDPASPVRPPIITN